MFSDTVRFLSLFSACFALGACSYLDSTPEPETAGPDVQAVELFLSRSSLGATEFEQYKISGGLLYAECGAIARGRFLPRSQESFDLAEDVQQKISGEAGEVVSFIAAESPSFPSSGTNGSFADPGQFFLTILTGEGKREIRTSLDAVSSTDGRGEVKLRRVAESIRKSADFDRCGLKDFFGIRG